MDGTNGTRRPSPNKYMYSCVRQPSTSWEAVATWPTSAQTLQCLFSAFSSPSASTKLIRMGKVESFIPIISRYVQ